MIILSRKAVGAGFKPAPTRIFPGNHRLHQPRRGGGGQGQDELGLGNGLVDEFGGLKHNGQVPLDFAGPAAGKQGDGEGLRVQVMPPQKGSPVT